MPKFETKNALFWYFCAGIWKECCHIWSQHPRSCSILKFWKKTKILKFETKNTLFWCLWAEIWKEYCHIWNQHPRICLIAKILLKKQQKYLKFGPKMPYWGIFGLEFPKAIVRFELSTFEFVELENFMKKWKRPYLGTKSLIWVFWI